MNAPEKEENVPFELGKKRGKVFVPKYNEEEMQAMKKKEEIAQATKLDDDEESALADASVEDLMALAEIVGTNPQMFVMEAYSDPLKYYAPEPPNTTNPQESIDKVCNVRK